MGTMKIDDYVAEFDYDAEEKSFHGRFINMSDVVTFWGDSAKALEREARASLKVYLEVCKERGIEPSKPYSGKFQIRMTPELHRSVADAAALAGKTLNAWVNETLEKVAEEDSEG